ncbi:MAG: ADP-ribosylglycohydrolase family protein [Acidobacteriia bacterium]|nr:ADP-ribosylglycohydrolase family protein [Terriglobia bacterium]
MRPQLFPRQEDSAETLWAIDRALELAEARNPPESAIPAIGPAWVGEEALGVALHCALSTANFSLAVRMAVNHDGDSDTTGSLVGAADGRHARGGGTASPLARQTGVTGHHSNRCS